MKLYKSTLTLRSLSASLWHADTIFGHLCWFLFRHRGETYLQQFLIDYEGGNTPILVSDGFPGDFLPRPLLPMKSTPRDIPKNDRIYRQRQEKAEAHTNWVTLEDFNLVRRGETVNEPIQEHDMQALFRRRVTPKNQIDRLTNTTGDGAGQLYDMEEFVLPMITLYWHIAEGYLDTVTSFLDDLSVTGYGKRKSIGYGQIEQYIIHEFSGFTEISNANGFVSLSRFVPAPADPLDGFWQTTVKYGKLGEEYATDNNPFKRPLLMLQCGSCFRDSPLRESYGQLLSGLSIRPEVRDYGFAFPIPMLVPDHE